MSIVRLNGRNFVQQMCRYGFFSEQIPPCFNSIALANHSNELRTLVGKARSTSPTTLSIFKTQTTRRIVSAANPYAFICAASYMAEHRRQILQLTKSSHSESPITFIHSYGQVENFEKGEVINSDLARSALRAKSDYVTNLRERVIIAMGFRYRLSIDIATFYDSIYTHSVAWAICGKQDAKRMFPEEGKSLRTQDYYFADGLDVRMRNQKAQETSGILTGPFTSRIFSEIILCAIDKELDGQGFVFKRFVDDYKFYFRSEPDAQHAIAEIGRVLSEFNLAINQSKVAIEGYPFDLESSLFRRLQEGLRNNGVFGALSEAGKLHMAGEKGAYKYALKMLKCEKVAEEDRKAVLSTLFNINLLNPGYARYIIGFLTRSKEAVGPKTLSKIINSELNLSLEENYEQEVLNLLYFLRVMGLDIDGELLLKALRMRNDFISILALDLWVNSKEYVQRERTVAHKLNEARDTICDELRGSSMDGEHWLLLYEAKMHGLFDADITVGRTAKLFEKMANLGISFYDPLAEPK